MFYLDIFLFFFGYFIEKNGIFYKKKNTNKEIEEIEKQIKDLEQQKKIIINQGKQNCSPQQGLSGTPSDEIMMKMNKCIEKNNAMIIQNKENKKKEIEQLDDNILQLNNKLKSLQPSTGGKRRTKRRTKRTNKRKKTKTIMKRRKTSNRKTNKRRRKR